MYWLLRKLAGPCFYLALLSQGFASPPVRVCELVSAQSRRFPKRCGTTAGGQWAPNKEAVHLGTPSQCYAKRMPRLHKLSKVVCNGKHTLTEARSAVIQAGSCSGSTQKGPPIRKPEPVWGHCCGTLGPAPGWNFTLLPFVCCAPQSRGRTSECSS